MPFPAVEQFERLLTKHAPYMSSSVNKGRLYSPGWESEFEETLSLIFKGDEDRLTAAAKGYIRFALDAIRLQKRFEKERQYIAKTYAEAANAVYHNREYMFDLYLPGILLSQYLWPHHYRQLQYFRHSFVPLMRASADKRFADVGVGTGFYSRQSLASDPALTGVAFDISEHSLAYARSQIEAFQFQNRWRAENRNIITQPSAEKYPFVISVEVLEHLEDPVAFIAGLKRMMAPGGRGFITAAITAPNEDHIHLYNNCEDVISELRQGGCEVLDYQEDIAYPPQADEPVPRLGAFIVRSVDGR